MPARVFISLPKEEKFGRATYGPGETCKILHYIDNEETGEKAARLLLIRCLDYDELACVIDCPMPEGIKDPNDLDDQATIDLLIQELKKSDESNRVRQGEIYFAKLQDNEGPLHVLVDHQGEYNYEEAQDWGALLN